LQLGPAEHDAANVPHGGVQPADLLGEAVEPGGYIARRGIGRVGFENAERSSLAEQVYSDGAQLGPFSRAGAGLDP
jgi:hypothetical protein